MRVDRIEKLEKFILDNKTASLDSLCQRFDVSKNTLRRDIDALCERGNIKKVYGGVVAVEKGQAVGLKPFKERSAINSELKLSIAEKTAKMINDGDTLFIDTGSSTFPLVNLLKNLKDITIVTNSVPFIYHAMACDNLNIIALPGTLNRSTDSLVGASTIESLKRFHVKKAIMACTGLSVEHGACNASFSEYEIKRTAMSICDEAFLLADNNKFGVTSMMSYAELNQFDHIITDKRPADAITRYLNESGVELVC